MQTGSWVWKSLSTVWHPPTTLMKEVKTNALLNQFHVIIYVFLSTIYWACCCVFLLHIYLRAFFYLCIKNVLWKMKSLRMELKLRWSVTSVCAPVETGFALLWPAMVGLAHRVHVKRQQNVGFSLSGHFFFLSFRRASSAGGGWRTRRGRRDDRRRVEQESGWTQSFTGNKVCHVLFPLNCKRNISSCVAFFLQKAKFDN